MKKCFSTAAKRIVQFRILVTFASFVLIMLILGMKPADNQIPGSNKQTFNEWGEWVNDDCFEGIDYRVKRGDYNSYARKWNWYAQFRNRYNKKLNFNYALDEPGTRPDPDHRDHISGNSKSDSKIVLLSSSTACRVRVGYIRFGYDDSGEYESCDQ